MEYRTAFLYVCWSIKNFKTATLDAVNIRRTKNTSRVFMNYSLYSDRFADVHYCRTKRKNCLLFY